MSASLASSFTVHCPSCDSGFPVDPEKVPDGGIYAICSNCERTFLVSRPEGGKDAAPEAPEQAREPAAEPASGTEAAEITFEESTFSTDLDDRAPPSEGEAGDPAGSAEEATSEGGFSLDPPSAEAPAGATDPSTESPDEGTDLEDEPFEFAPSGEAEETAPSPPPSSAAPAPPEADTHEPPEGAAEGGSGETPGGAEAPAGFEDLRGLASEAVSEGAGSHTGGSTLSGGAERFGRRDPQDRAKRLARVLVSDIIAYYPERFQESRARGTVKEDFEAEVQKSWKEYVDQVGQEMAESTPYFTEALNEILAGGQEVF